MKGKNISPLQLAVSFVGVFLGAGFVSGQELWQFFGCFGAAGLPGFLLSAVLAVLVDYALLQLARKTDSLDVGMLIFPRERSGWRTFVDLLQCLLLFGIVVIMLAGGAALLSELTGFPPAVCGAVFTVVVLAAAMFELRGILTVFSLLVPVTAALAVVLGVTILFRQEFRFAPAVGSVAPLLPNWWISGITYAAYNLFGTVGILVVMAPLLKNGKTVRKGLSMGAVLLLVLTFCILSAMAAVPACGNAELPTAMLAAQLHPALGLVYQLLMGFGMFAAALSTVIALCGQAAFHIPVVEKRRKPALCLFLLASYGLSLLGFSDLVSIVYPFFGYASVPFMALLVRNWWKQRKS